MKILNWTRNWSVLLYRLFSVRPNLDSVTHTKSVANTDLISHAQSDTASACR